jgi:two-component system chemotaxis sensor kinase CheA
MTFEDAELIKEFVVESQEHLADVENQLLSLEAQGDQINVGLVNTVFRAVHSIKGTAGFMGLETIGNLAHREEEVLNRLRNGDLRPTSEVINTLLKASDQLKILLDSIETSNDQDVSGHIVALERILQHDSAAPTASPDVEACESPEPAAACPDDAPATAAPDSVSSEALREFLVESYDNLEQLERDLITLEREPTSEPTLRSVFRTIHTVKGTAGFLGYTRLERLTHVGENLLGSLRSGQILLDSEISTGLFALVDAIRKMLAVIETTGNEGDAEPTELLDRLIHLQESKLSGGPVGNGLRAVPSGAKPDVVPSGAAPVANRSSQTANLETEPAAASLPSRASPSADAHNTSAADSTIRVDVALLDKLMTRVGELVLARNQILQFTSSLGDASLLGTSQRLNLITTELQEGVMKTRMQQIGNVWSKFPRLVRDLATTCGKQIRIEMEGKETELDKTIIEAIKDPLTHLVRNTVDHGIEAPASRIALGKPAEGCLMLRAFHEGGQVNIEISDDGAGLNLERIKQKAVDRGIISPEQAARMADREIAQLIFLPGFSTAEKVSNVSGRGVGMDVVKTNIEKIGGTVDVQTQAGKGAAVKIKIPLTLAIIPALIVSSDGDRYAIPQVNLLELVRLEGEHAQQGIEWIQGAPVYRLRGKLLPLVYLSDTLGTKGAGDDRNGSGGATTKAGRTSIDFKLARDRHLAWKTRLLDYLDGKGMIDESEAASPRACAFGKWLYAEGLRDFGHLPSVQRLEQLHAQMHAAVGEVIRCKQKDGPTAAEAAFKKVETSLREVVALLDVLKETAEGANVVNVVVLRADDRQFGLVVDRINDTEEIVVKPLSKQLKGVSVYSGATIMGDGKVALILDVLGLAHSAHVVSETRDRSLVDNHGRGQEHGSVCQTLLVLGVGKHRRLALPISQVARLEKIAPHMIEQADHQEVVQYRGAILPLIRLAKMLDVEPLTLAEEAMLQVVVYSEKGRSVGLIVDRIVDIVEAVLDVTRRTRRDGLLGSAVIQEHVTDLLDLPAIIRQADPLFFEEHAAV